MSKKHKIIFSEAELDDLSTSFSYDEILEMFEVDEALLTKALARLRASTAETRDRQISAPGFKKFFSTILIFS